MSVTSFHPWRSLRDLVDVAAILSGLVIVGYGANDYKPLANSGTADAVTVTSNGTRLVTSTKTIERVVKGRIVHRENRVFVQVPLVIVHVDHRTIRVPAHRLPLRSALAVTANPLVTVTAYVPTTTFVPTTVYSTVTDTVTSTEIVPTTITVTLPIFTTGGGPDT